MSSYCAETFSEVLLSKLNELSAFYLPSDSINLAHNHFEGSFPPEWTGLAGLRELDISTNELIGEIPIFIDGMKDLRSLNMAHNDFSSSIPSQLGR